MKHSKLLIALILFILIPVGFYFFIKRQRANNEQWYTTATPTSKALTQYITAAGRLQAQDKITVGSLVAGRIVTLHVDDNDFVKKDQVLVELDDGVGYSAVKKATANLKQAVANLNYIREFYKRQKVIFEAGQLAQDTFESYKKNYKTAKAQALAAEAELEINRQAYENLFIKAPDAGIIIARKVDLGQMVTAQLQATELFIIARDLKKMEAEIDVDESDIGVVKVGQEALFSVDAFPQKQFKAKVKQINYDYKVVENVITYGVILDVQNPDLALRPGMTTNVNIKVAATEKTICVPNKALRVSENVIGAIAEREGLSFHATPKTVETKAKETLWVLENETQFKEVPIELGVTDGKFTQVKKGIAPGQEIVIEAFDPNRENPIMNMSKMKV